MALRYLRYPTLVLAMSLLTGCGGGGSSGSGAAAIRACGEAGSFCLVDCNLGCNFKGCSLTDIAQNQPLVFTFSRDIDPNTVGFGSISLKTPSGSEPVGNFFVEGPTVTFVPDVLNLGGAAFFGFTSGETYFLEIAGGDTAATPLRATSGDLLGESIRCSVRISLGVVDLDGKPPQVKVLSPVFTTGVPLNANIVLEFDELIDHGSFAGVTGADAPIIYQMRKTEEVPQGSGIFQCLSSSVPRVLPGEPQLIDDKIRGVTTVIFTPLQSLPGTGCLEISVTAAVRDLAGTPAPPLTFQFVTVISDLPPQNVDENFSDDLMLDLERSSGSWGNGSGIFGKAGGDGRLGDFDITDGIALDEDETIWEWNTDGMTIVSDETLSSNFLNQSIPVNDGVFQFTDFVLPEEMTLRIVGRRSLRIFVRGRCDIFGKIEINAIDQTDDAPWAGKAKDALGNPMPLPQRGMRGTAPGAGGSFGGRGASTGGVGFKGGDLRLNGAHIFLSRSPLTGGAGGPVVPAHGDPALVDFTTPPPDLFGTAVETYSQYVAGGGGGGGLLQPGQDGRVVSHAFKSELFGPVVIPALDLNFVSPNGPNVTGGIAFDFLPKPDGESSDHYVFGGAGGGGGGSHAILGERTAPPALIIEPVLFNTGAGGAGGGGAVAIRVGRSLTTGPLSVIECKGGSAANQTRAPAAFGAKFPDGIASPGGGGSGGSILLMVDGDGELQGSLDVSPGKGGFATLDIPPAGQNSKFAYDTRGGDGSPGYIRLEVAQANPSIDLLGTHLPAGSGAVGELKEDWPTVAFQSLWYETGQVFAPLFQRYEIEAEVNGVTVTYSDDPAVGTVAQHGVSPLAFYVQGGDIVPGSGQVLDPGAVVGWREYVGSFNPIPGGPSLNGDNKNGFRWILILDRDFGADVVIKRVRIVFKP